MQNIWNTHNEWIKKELLSGDYTEQELDQMTPEEAFDKWLEWEGIIGFTNKIKQAYQGLFPEPRQLLVDNTSKEAGPKPFLDITGAGVVEVVIGPDDSILWVNIPGGCVLRICRIEKGVVIDDMRSAQRKKESASKRRMEVVAPKKSAAEQEPPARSNDPLEDLSEVPNIDGSEQE